MSGAPAIRRGDEPERVRPVALGAAVVAALAAWLLGHGLDVPEGVDPRMPPRALAITTLTAVCWLARAMPLGPASLLPLALFPVFGVVSTRVAASAYAHPILWMFWGGFVLALAIERWGLHRRMALLVIAGVGLRPRRLVLGFLMAGLLLSMWISNTATSLSLLPIGWALVDRVQRAGVLGEGAGKRFGICLMLGIAYGCSIGGTATPIGTAPNLLYFANHRLLEQQSGAPPLSFLTWMLAFVPFALLLGGLVWLLLTRVLFAMPGRVEGAAVAGILAEARDRGPMTGAERRVLALFMLAVLLWVTRGDLQLGRETIVPGWASRLGLPANFVTDGSVAVGVAILTFLVPSAGRGSQRLMDWETARRLPYEILFLLGGGVAIASAFEQSGLSASIGAVLGPAVGDTPAWLAVLVVALGITFMTEVTSNTAITSLMLPVLAAAADSAGRDPRLLMLPAAIAASCAFMLPIATPPNAVVFSSGKVTMPEMARAGVLLNFVAVAVLTVVLLVWVLPLLGVETSGPPRWGR